MKKTTYVLAIMSVAIIISACLISITLHPIGDATSWLDTDFRQMDIADNLYSVAYQESFTYGQPEMPVVTFTYNNKANTFKGTLTATGLKPNFAYQMKLVGKPDLDDWSNEQIGYAGRWWRKQPNPGNSNDTEYEANRDNPDYIFEGYLLFDFFVTDEIGNVSISFAADSSFHVLWATHGSTGDGTGHRDPGQNDSDERFYEFNASRDTNPVAYGQEYQLGKGATVGIYAEWEPYRALPGELVLPAGNYKCKLILTEESFHSPPGSPGGYWAGAMQGNVNFTIISAP